MTAYSPSDATTFRTLHLVRRDGLEDWRARHRVKVHSTLPDIFQKISVRHRGIEGGALSLQHAGR